MSPLEVYCQGKKVLVVEPGESDTLKPANTNRRFLLECAPDDSHSVIIEIGDSVSADGILIALSQQPKSERTVYQGQARILTFNHGTRRESVYGLQQTRVLPSWRRTGRSG